MPDTHDLKVRIAGLAKPYLDSRPYGALMIGLLQNHTRHTLGFGRINSAPPDARTLFEIGSVTKVFTALTLASLAIDGRVQLDDPISALLPKEVRTPERNVRSITLRHLATHTSGLPRLPGNFDLSDVDVTNPYINYAAKDLYQDLGQVKLSSTPGATMEYSNYGAGLLGHLLALKTGRSYEAQVLETVCRPLDLRDTVFCLSSEQQARLAAGHDPEGKLVPAWEFDVLAPAGALRSTVADLLWLLQANLSRPNSDLGRAIAETQRKQFEDRTGAIGLGWHILPARSGQQIHWHNGGTAGSVSFVGCDLENRVAVALLSNCGDAFAGDNSVDKMGVEILKLAARISYQ